MTDAFRQYYRDIRSRGSSEYCLAVSYDLILWVDERNIIFREQCKVGVRKLMGRLKKVLERHGKGGFVHGDAKFCTVSIHIIARRSRPLLEPGTVQAQAWKGRSKIYYHAAHT